MVLVPLVLVEICDGVCDGFEQERFYLLNSIHQQPYRDFQSRLVKLCILVQQLMLVVRCFQRIPSNF
jgi:hypothetical protein